MSVAKPTGTCPYCKETIHPAATKCKHCQSDLSAVKKQKTSVVAKYNTFRYGFATGCAFTVALLILAYFQFFRE